MAIVFDVNFAGAADTVLTTGFSCAVGSIASLYDIVPGSTLELDGSGYLRLDGSGVASRAFASTSGTQTLDGTFTVNVKTGGAGNTSVLYGVFRIVSSGNYYNLIVIQGTGGVLIQTNVGGTPTATVCSHSTGYAASTDYRIDVTYTAGGTFTIYRNSVQVATGTDTTHTTVNFPPEFFLYNDSNATQTLLARARCSDTVDVPAGAVLAGAPTISVTRSANLTSPKPLAGAPSVAITSGPNNLTAGAAGAVLAGAPSVAVTAATAPLSVPKPLAGAPSVAVTASTAPLSVPKPLAGAPSVAVTAATAPLSVPKPLAGAPSVAVTSGPNNLTTPGAGADLAGTPAISVAAVAAQLNVPKPLAGAPSVAVTAATAPLSVPKQLAGAPSVVVTSGPNDLTAGGAGAALAGTPSVAITATPANLQVDKPLAGAPSIAVTSGPNNLTSPGAAGALQGSPNIVVTAGSANLNSPKPLNGAASIAVIAAPADLLAFRPLAGNLVVTALIVPANLLVAKDLGGLPALSVGAGGTLNSPKPLNGAASITLSVLANLTLVTPQDLVEYLIVRLGARGEGSYPLIRVAERGNGSEITPFERSSGDVPPT